MVSRGRAAAYRQTHGRILLLSDEAHAEGAMKEEDIALACGEPPEGRAGWTLKLLAHRLVECEIVESISTETVRQTLKKAHPSLG